MLCDPLDVPRLARNAAKCCGGSSASDASCADTMRMMPFTRWSCQSASPASRLVNAPASVSRSRSSTLNHSSLDWCTTMKSSSSGCSGAGARALERQQLVERQVAGVGDFVGQKVETSSAAMSSTRIVSVVKNGSPYRARIIEP